MSIKTSMSAAAIGNQRQEHPVRPLYSHSLLPAAVLQFTPSNLLTTTQGELDDSDQSWVVGDTYLFSPTLVNQFRASVDRLAVIAMSRLMSRPAIWACRFIADTCLTRADFTVTGAFTVGPGTGGPAQNHTTPLQINDDINWVHGAHQINFGGGGEVSKMLFYGNVYAQTNWTFNNIPAFLLGEFSTNSMSLPNDLTAGEMVHEFLRAGYLEGKLPLYRQLWVALGAVLPAVGNQRLGVQLQPGRI